MLMGEEERTGPIWYRRLTKSEEPSNFLEEEREFGGSLGLKKRVLVWRVWKEGEATAIEEERKVAEKERRRRKKRNAIVRVCEAVKKKGKRKDFIKVSEGVKIE